MKPTAFDWDKAEITLDQHFDNLTTEQFVVNLQQTAPWLFEDLPD